MFESVTRRRPATVLYPDRWTMQPQSRRSCRSRLGCSLARSGASMVGLAARIGTSIDDVTSGCGRRVPLRDGLAVSGMSARIGAIHPVSEPPPRGSGQAPAPGGTRLGKPRPWGRRRNFSCNGGMSVRSGRRPSLGPEPAKRALFQAERGQDQSSQRRSQSRLETRVGATECRGTKYAMTATFPGFLEPRVWRRMR
jgi:hypothetical protein